MYQVIIKDSFDRENVSDRVYKTNLSAIEAHQLADEMNAKQNEEFSSDYYKAVTMEYKLYDASSIY